MSAELKAARSNGTLIMTLSNPGARNALHPDMYAAAIETLSTAERDDSVRAVILTGTDGFFCAGGNLNRLLENRGMPGRCRRTQLTTCTAGSRRCEIVPNQ